MNQNVSDYIQKAPADQQEIMETIRWIIHESVPRVSEDFKWNRPVFRTDHDFAYLKTAKNHVTLGFFKFHKLDDKENRLEGTGNDMRHIKLKSKADIDGQMLKKWFKTVA